MEIDLSAFHFLRPWALLLAAAGVLLWVAERTTRKQDAGRYAVSSVVLPYLLVRTRGSRGPSPIDGLAALMLLGGIAAAGPSWQQDRPAFLDDQASLVVALDLSPSMDANDVPPSRLEAAKYKIHDLSRARKGARTGLVVYAGSAHVVLPPTTDPDLLDLYVQALSSNLITASGKDAAEAIRQAEVLLRGGGGQDAGAGGTVLLITDGADQAGLPDVEHAARSSTAQVLVLAAGVRDTGVLRDSQGRARAGSDGKPLTGHFDPQALRSLSRAADAPLGSVSMNADDIQWVELHVRRHYQAALEQSGVVRWKDAGYWLCVPLALIALLGVRRGWSVGWNAIVLGVAVALSTPTSARAGPIADAFVTPDQQGRWAWEHGDYGRAAQLFADPYWKGRAAYQAGDWNLALAAFARLDTAEGYFYTGNTQARLFKYEAALAAYGQALRLRPDFPEAAFNRKLVARLLADLNKNREQEQTDEKPDKQEFDNSGDQGKMQKVEVSRPDSADVWLRGLAVSPARFLRTKFAVEDARRTARPAMDTPRRGSP